MLCAHSLHVCSHVGSEAKCVFSRIGTFCTWGDVTAAYYCWPSLIAKSGACAPSKVGGKSGCLQKGALEPLRVGSKSLRILGANSVTLSAKYLEKLGFYHQLFSHRCAFSQARGDRENRLFVTVPQVCPLSYLCDGALCTLLPFLSCLCPS